MTDNLNNILKKCNQSSLLSGKLCYTDNVPYDSDKTTGFANSAMKYCEGVISKDDHEKPHKDHFVYNIYEKYIFSECDALSENLNIDEVNVENLIILRLTLSENSEHIERFDKLMLRVYYELKEDRLTGLVQSIFEKYDWAKEYVKNHSDDTRSMVFLEEAAGYNKSFGIQETELGNERVETSSNANKKAESDESDWILKKYGGQQRG